MCGIVGYVGERECSGILLDGLKRLEYRGYDSSGICTVDDGEFKLLKREGRIVELEKSEKFKFLSGKIGIAHTRWATHGEPNSVNAHPHVSNDRIAIVHNGIIENYHSLKKLLENDGYVFLTQTDSEVVAHLIDKFYDGNLEKAFVKAANLIEGAFGLAIVCKNENKLIAARRGSPLILGVGKNEMFVASDVSAVLSYTKNVVYLDDDEYAVLTGDDYVVKNLKGEILEKDVHEIKWSVDRLEKNGFKHFMLKEIFEQPDAIRNALRGRIKYSKISLNVGFNFEEINKIFIVACGTSWHSALIGKQIIERNNKIPVEVDYASEFRYKDPIVGPNDLVIAISQSGETADTLAAIREAKSKGARTFGIVNVVGSTIAREVDSGIYLHAGPEIGVASTKAFTSQVMSLLLLSLYVSQKKGIDVSKNIFEILSLEEKMKFILEKCDLEKVIADKIGRYNNILYLGRGLNFPVALEGALKLKEISYIHAEGYPAAEIKHGPIALIEKGMPVVFVMSKDLTYEKVLSNVEEVKARGGHIIVVSSYADEKLRKIADDIIEVPNCDEMLSPILNIIPLQLLAYYVADMKGIDVDKPRNLAKSVTVE